MMALSAASSVVKRGDTTVLSDIRTTKSLINSQRLKKSLPVCLQTKCQDFSCAVQARLRVVAIPRTGKEKRGDLAKEKQCLQKHPLGAPGMCFSREAAQGITRETILTVQGIGPFLANPINETLDLNIPDQFQRDFSFYKRIHSRLPSNSQLSWCILNGIPQTEIQLPCTFK